jgi:hypothetical protein
MTESESNRRRLLDLKIVERPPIFESDDAQWPEWKFIAENWLGVLDTRYRSLLQAAQYYPGTVPTQVDMDMRLLQQDLYTVLTGL